MGVVGSANYVISHECISIFSGEIELLISYFLKSVRCIVVLAICARRAAPAVRHMLVQAIERFAT